jgi:hypothetical protein
MTLQTIASDPRKLTTLIATNLVVLAVHAASHSALSVALSDFQSLFVLLAMIIGPIIAVPLLFIRLRAGLWLLLVSMLSSFIFGFVYHLILPGVDNIFTVPPGDWKIVFQATTVLLGILEATGTLLLSLGLLKRRTTKVSGP